MKKLIFSTFVVFIMGLTSSTSFAQNGGARVYTGISTMINRDVVANPKGMSHTGFHVGLDARLMSGGMSFLIGGKYASFSQLPIDGFKLLGHDQKMDIINGRGGLGFSIITFNRYFRLRSKILASLDVVLSTTDESSPAVGYILNDGWFGFVTGLGADLGPIAIDFEFEYGVINGYYQKSNSKFNTISFAVGFFF